MIYFVEEIFKIDIYYPSVSFLYILLRFLYCIMSSPLWAKSITVLGEHWVIQRCEDLGYCLLDETICHGGNS